MKIHVFCILLALSFAACKKEVVPEGCESGKIKYTTHISPILSASCAVSGCHVAGGTAPVFASYSDLAPFIANGSFKTQLITSRTMPPAGPLTTTQREDIQCWLDEGALNN